MDYYVLYPMHSNWKEMCRPFVVLIQAIERPLNFQLKFNMKQLLLIEIKPHKL